MATSPAALGEIARTVEAQLASLAARETAWAEQCRAILQAGARQQERLADHAARRAAFSARTETILQQTALTDEELSTAETQLRDLAERIDGLRQKLAAWAKRAVT